MQIDIEKYPKIPIGRARDLHGKKFGRLQPLYRTHNSKSKDVQWCCKCDCGNITSVTATNLTSGHTKSCGCLAKETARLNGINNRDKISQSQKGKHIINEINNQYKDWLVISLGQKVGSNGVKFWLCECQKCHYKMEINGTYLRLNRFPECPSCTDKLSIINKTFGKLTVLEASQYRDSNNGSILYKCQCECGNIVYRRRQQLKDEHFSSCGCDMKYKQREALKKEFIGKQIDDLLVLSLNEDQFLYGEYTWNCQCKCGNIVIKNTSVLKDKKHYHSCNDCARVNHRVPLNTKIGYLEIKNYINDPKDNSLVGYQCYCHKCNNLVNLDTVKYRNIVRRQGNIATCGCTFTSSYGEEKIKDILKENNITYLHDKAYFKDLIFPKTNGIGRFDFIIFNQQNQISHVIEYDGEQHFLFKTNTKGWNNYDNYLVTKEHDEFKNQWCKDNNIPLIRIPYWHLQDLCVEDLLLETSKFIVGKECDEVTL